MVGSWFIRISVLVEVPLKISYDSGLSVVMKVGAVGSNPTTDTLKFLMLYPLQEQAHCPEHTYQLYELSV